MYFFQRHVWCIFLQYLPEQGRGGKDSVFTEFSTYSWQTKLEDATLKILNEGNKPF